MKIHPHYIKKIKDDEEMVECLLWLFKWFLVGVVMALFVCAVRKMLN